MKNFYLTKSKSSPYWQVIFFRNGKRSSKSTNTKIKSEALLFLTQFKEQLNQKKFIPKTFFEFEKEYIAFAEKTFSKSYLRSIVLSFKMFKSFLGKDILLSDISAKLVDQFFSFSFARAEYSAKLYLRTLKSAFSTAIRWGVIENNVFKEIKPPKSFKKFPAYLKEDDLEKVCEVTKETYLKNLFWFAFLTGARLNEILSLTWENINLEERTILISNTKTFRTKNKQDRLIPINQKLFEILSSMKMKSCKKDELLFYRIKGIKLSSEFVSKKFKKATRKVGLSEKIHFHVLRHSFASLIHQKGVSLNVVKELLGHQDIKTTLIYSHLSKENLVNAVELIGSNKTTTKENFISLAGEIQINLNMN